MLRRTITGIELLQAVERLSFDFSAEKTESGLPSELQSLFENAGKRFRPALCFLFGELFGLDIDALTPYAKAVEMTHTASLVHDDVIDEAAERRKVSTLNNRFSNTSAVLGGDFLLAKVIGDLTSLGNLELITDLTNAIKDLADGEWLQHKLKIQFKANWPELEMVARKKTGSLMVWSCTTPAKLSGQSKEVVAICRSLGDDIGVFFQMLDDVNDFNSNSGKPFAQDLKNGQLNFVTSKMVEGRPEMYQAFREFQKNGDFTARNDLKESITATYNRALEIENDLNARFKELASERAPHMVDIFAKMLVKVRESFLPKGI